MSAALGDILSHFHMPVEINILFPRPTNLGCWLSKNEMSCTKTYFLLFNFQQSDQQVRMTKTIAISGLCTMYSIENASYLEVQSCS